jgi:hypothetical protein
MSPAWLNWVRPIGGPTSFSLFFFFAELGPVHDPHGCWLGPATMLIIIDVACKLHFACNTYRKRGEKKKREWDYLAWKEWLVSPIVDWWWSCWWRHWQLVLVLVARRKFVVERKEFIVGSLQWFFKLWLQISWCLMHGIHV